MKRKRNDSGSGPLRVKAGEDIPKGSTIWFAGLVDDDGITWATAAREYGGHVTETLMGASGHVFVKHEADVTDAIDEKLAKRGLPAYPKRPHRECRCGGE